MDDAYHEYRRFRSDHPGNPLGKGYPSGSPLRLDGESHLLAWMRIVRNDPCSFCGSMWWGSADHIEPKAFPVKGLGGAHCWTNLAGACSRCNGSKDAKSLLWFLWLRSPKPVERLPSARRRRLPIPTEEKAA